MADVTKREISGFFLSAEKFASHVAALAKSGCGVTHLRLFHNEPHHTAAVVDALGRNVSVVNLDIFELDPAAAGALAAVLAASPRLTSLAVHHPQGHQAVVNLCRGISANRTLRRLHLSHLDAHGVIALANALLAWATPRTPDPDGAVSAPQGAPAVGDDNPPRLQQLRLEKCTFSREAASALAEALGRQAGALVQLEIVESDLGDAAAEALLAAPGWTKLGATGTLDSLNLSSCHVGPRGVTALGRFLGHSESLQTLNLANNKSVGCEGARALAAGLVANRALHRLDLSGCGIGAAGVKAIAAALRPSRADSGAEGPLVGPPLEHLGLGDNAAGAAGLVELLLAMSGSQPCALRALLLNHNYIRGAELTEALGLAVTASAGASEVAAQQAVRVTAPLRELSLAGNALYDVGIKLLAEALAEAPCLEQLDVRENGISDAGVAALLPLVAPGGTRRGSGAGGGAAAAPGRASGGGAAAVTVAVGATPHASGGLQGLLLDGNRLHNAGAQALLDAITAAPGLWKFSVEGNKLTDPALRMSLAQLSQLRAARHSQLVVLGRQYSSSSSSSASEEGGHRGSGGGAGGGGRSDEAVSPMEVDGGNRKPPGQAAGAAQKQQQQHQNKHRLEEPATAAGEEDSGDVGQSLRNVAARSEDGWVHGGGDSGGGGGGGGGGGTACAMQHSAGRQPMSESWPCVPSALGGVGPSRAVGADSWCGACSVPSCDGAALISRGWSSGGGSSMDCGSGGDMTMQGSDGDGSGGSRGGRFFAASTLTSDSGAGGGVMGCSSPPPAVCFVTALTGVGGATSVGVSKRVGGAVDSDQHQFRSPAPQQLLPACRRPRYKPLTPEQQRLFDDF